MKQRQPRCSDQEQMNLIHECRSSGLSDRTWCEEHHIQSSNFYYHIRRLRKLTCSIPQFSENATQDRQEVVAITFDKIVKQEAFAPNPDIPSFSPMETAIIFHYHGLQIDISNSAAGTTILNTLSSLQKQYFLNLQCRYQFLNGYVFASRKRICQKYRSICTSLFYSFHLLGIHL